MRPVKKIILLAAILIVIALIWTVGRRHIPSDIEYQGEKIKLTKYYLSYEDYKDDPDNIDPSEYARVEQLVTRAPIGRQFTDRKKMIAALFELKFPGYGLSFGGRSVQTGGTVLELSSVEIPRADKNRYFLYEERDGSYTLVDDFVAPSSPEIMRVKGENGALIYSTRSGQNVLTRPIPAKNKP